MSGLVTSTGTLETTHRRVRATIHRLATVLHDSNDALTMQDLEGNILAWNRAAERMYGYSEAEALRMNVEVLVPEEDRAQARGFLEAIRRGEKIESLEVRRRTKEGRILDVWLTTTKLIDDEGEPIAVATTERDVTERRRAEEERIRLIAELRDALQERDEFLSIASHELRTPIAALTIALDLLAFKARSFGAVVPQELIAAIERAIRQTKRITSLIDELLDVARIRTGRLVLSPEELDLADLVREVVERLRGILLRERFGVDLSGLTSCVGRWDRQRIGEVLENLLSNAVRYGGSPLSIATFLENGHVVITVRDHGRGISKELQARIFERFVTSEPMRGLGLGLYVARQIAEAHGGTISVESEMGKGSLFRVRLPRI